VIVFEWIIAILLGAVLLSQLAKRIGVPYPALLALGGAGLAFIPGAPRIVLEPELALALFLAPVLLDAAYLPAISKTTGCLSPAWCWSRLALRRQRLRQWHTR
jgi:NhaP-type Na+/H+ or K+/H+ antiporter